MVTMNYLVKVAKTVYYLFLPLKVSLPKLPHRVFYIEYIYYYTNSPALAKYITKLLANQILFMGSQPVPILK